MFAPAINVESLAGRYPAALALDVIGFSAVRDATARGRAERGL